MVSKFLGKYRSMTLGSSCFAKTDPSFRRFIYRLPRVEENGVVVIYSEEGELSDFPGYFKSTVLFLFQTLQTVY